MSEHYKLVNREFDNIGVSNCGIYDPCCSLAYKAQQLVRKRIISWLDCTENCQSVADIGCGRGDFTSIICSDRSKVIGIDISEEMISLCSGYKSNIADFRVGNILDLPAADVEVDCAVCVNVLHHVRPNDWDRGIKELCRISRRYAIIEFKNSNNIFYPYVRWAWRGAVQRYSTRARSLENLLRKNNYQISARWYIFGLNIISPIGLLFAKKEA